MSSIRDTININVEYFTDDEEYGPYYVASCDDISLVTDGQTFEELLMNLKEALSLVLEEDVRADLHLVANPRIILTMQLPGIYAKTA